MSKKDKGKHGKDAGATPAARGEAMSKPRLKNGGPGQTSISHDDYSAQLHVLQVELGQAAAASSRRRARSMPSRTSTEGVLRSP